MGNFGTPETVVACGLALLDLRRHSLHGLVEVLASLQELHLHGQWDREKFEPGCDDVSVLSESWLLADAALLLQVLEVLGGRQMRKGLAPIDTGMSLKFVNVNSEELEKLVGCLREDVVIWQSLA